MKGTCPFSQSCCCPSTRHQSGPVLNACAMPRNGTVFEDENGRDNTSEWH